MQAILILAHKDIKQVLRLAEILQRKFQVFIHFDKKFKLSLADKRVLKKLNVKYISEVAVNWGSWSIGEATLRLMRLALSNKEISFFHIISGQDWPVIAIEKIYDFYKNNDRIYLNYCLAKSHKKSGENLLLWQKYYFNYDVIKRRTFFGKIYHRISLLIQTICGVDKLKDLNIKIDIYQGANWADLPRDVVEYMVNYLDQHRNLYQMLKTGCFSDEFWMQTILCNNGEYKKRIIKNNHRFIKWGKKYGSYPAILDENDYSAIKVGEYHFARKLDSIHSNKLIEKLAERENSPI